MKNYLLVVLAIVVHLKIQAQPFYDTASIPMELKEKANVIKRYENIRFDVKDIDRAVYSVHRVYTVMNEQGAKKLFFSEYTTKYRKIDEFEIRGYDASGKLIEKFKKKDLTRQAILDGLANDGNYHYIRLTTSKYPATIEYKYEIDYTGTAWYPEYEMQEEGESVESSTFTASVPSDLDLRFKARNTSVKPVVTTEGSIKKYQWSLKNSKVIPEEESEIEGVSNEPMVLLAPNKFRLYNTHGDMSSWKSFGTWGYELLQGLDQLSAERKAFFENLVKDARNDREKAAIIYNYLQKNFRYVSIQLGIGGWKPFPASFTDEKKYGDCKGLSFFMYSVLKSLGIKSYCALIYRDYNQEAADETFPYNRFNHMILCIPQKTDSIWLECTSNTAEFGVLDASTTNKNALLLTENGGKLVPTPLGNSNSNTVYSHTEVWMEEDGSGKTESKFKTRGEFKEDMLAMIEAKKDDQKTMIINKLGFKQPDDFIVSQKNKTEFLDVDVQLAMEKIPQFMTGNKMFLNQRLNPLWRHKLPTAVNRKQDFYFRCPLYFTDTTVYHLPEGFSAEVLPKPTSSKCEYAEYDMSCRYDAEKREIVAIARLQLHHNRIPSAKYAGVKSFFDKLLSDENQKLVVKKSD